MGQRDIAVLWSVDERSVKREMAREGPRLAGPEAARSAGQGGGSWSRPVRDPGADRRRLAPDRQRLCRADVAAGGGPRGPNAPPSNVISFPAPAGEGGLWSGLQARLYREDPNLYGAWFAALRAEPPGGRAADTDRPVAVSRRLPDGELHPASGTAGCGDRPRDPAGDGGLAALMRYPGGRSATAQVVTGGASDMLRMGEFRARRKRGVQIAGQPHKRKVPPRRRLDLPRRQGKPKCRCTTGCRSL